MSWAWVGLGAAVIAALLLVARLRLLVPAALLAIAAGVVWLGWTLATTWSVQWLWVGIIAVVAVAVLLVATQWRRYRYRAQGRYLDDLLD
jgi:membrane protein implicated in regulation of membrane protease activity